MPITEAQRQKRQQYLGSSDIAALLGFSAWRTAHDVWLEKTGRLPDGLEESAAMHAGTRFEGGVLDEAEARLGPIIRNTAHTPLEFINGGLSLIDHPDAILAKTGEPIEAKTVGLFGPVLEPWGEEATDEVPDSVILQDHVHMMCVAKEVCHTIAFIGGQGFRLYRVPRSEAVQEIIAEAVERFWVFVKSDTPPADSLPSAAALKRMRRVPGSRVAVDPAVVSEWLAAREARLAAEKVEAAADTRLKVALGDAEAGECDLGVVTYMEQTRHNKAREAFDSVFRTLRFKAKK